MKRILGLVLVMFAIPSSASAAGSDWIDLGFVNGQRTFKDPLCGTQYQVGRINLYTGTNYTGTRYILCYPESHLTKVPWLSGQPFNANDVTSSYNWQSGKWLGWKDTGFGGGAVIFMCSDNANMSHLDNELSSIEEFGGTC